MTRYEISLLRAYALAAATGVAAAQERRRRPQQRLAAWLADHAELLGCPAPRLPPGFRGDDAGRVDAESWAAFAPLVAGLREPRALPPRSREERPFLTRMEAATHPFACTTNLVDTHGWKAKVEPAFALQNALDAFVRRLISRGKTS